MANRATGTRVQLRPLSRISTVSPVPYESHGSPLLTTEEDSDLLSELYTQRVETCTQVLNQLSLSIRKHQGLLTYIQSLTLHLNRNLTIARSDLESRYHASMAQLAAQYEYSCTQLDLASHEKHTILNEKEIELRDCVQELEQARSQLELRLRAETRGSFVQMYQDHLNEARYALEQWNAEADLGDVITLPKLSTMTEDAMTQTEYIPALDQLQLELTEEFKQLEEKRREIMERSRPFLSPGNSPSPSPPRTRPVFSPGNSPSLSPQRTRLVYSPGNSPSPSPPRTRPSTKRVYHTERSHKTATKPIDVRKSTQKRVHIYRKDAIIVDLIQRYKELETLYNWAKHGTASPSVHEISRNTEILTKRVA